MCIICKTFFMKEGKMKKEAPNLFHYYIYIFMSLFKFYKQTFDWYEHLC